MSMVNLKYSARVISSDTGWGVFTTAGTTGIHYCWLCLWCPVLLSTAGTGIQYCYPLVVDQRFSSDNCRPVSNFRIKSWWLDGQVV